MTLKMRFAHEKSGPAFPQSMQETLDAILYPDREGKLTDAEFDALPRYDNGDIYDLAMAQIYMTPAQRDRVSEDDFTRLDDNDEEIRIMMAELEAEFGE